jgi:hypothetical protein
VVWSRLGKFLLRRLEARRKVTVTFTRFFLKVANFLSKISLTIIYRSFASMCKIIVPFV